MNDLELLKAINELCWEAGALEKDYFEKGTDTMTKQDGSPVTVADQEAEEMILAGLRALTPDIPIVAEESVAAGTIPDISGGRFWLVDPLDGTKEFVSGRGEFTVNIALLDNFRPVLGSIFAPMLDETYYGAVSDKAYQMNSDRVEFNISVRPEPEEGLTVVASRSHGDPVRIKEYLKEKIIVEQITRGSSIKFCAVASGQADIYTRFGPTSEWDIAAGEAVLVAAGGKVIQVNGDPIIYAKTDVKFLNPEFVALPA